MIDNANELTNKELYGIYLLMEEYKEYLTGEKDKLEQTTNKEGKK